jgi:hypothetical protein
MNYRSDETRSGWSAFPSSFFVTTAQYLFLFDYTASHCTAPYCRQQKRRLSRGMAKAYGNTSMASVIESATFSRHSSFAMMQDSEGQHVYTLASTYTQTKNVIPITLIFIFSSCSYFHLSTLLSSLYRYSATLNCLPTVLCMLNNETSPLLSCAPFSSLFLSSLLFSPLLFSPPLSSRLFSYTSLPSIFSYRYLIHDLFFS